MNTYNILMALMITDIGIFVGILIDWCIQSFDDE